MYLFVIVCVIVLTTIPGHVRLRHHLFSTKKEIPKLVCILYVLDESTFCLPKVCNPTEFVDLREVDCDHVHCWKKMEKYKSVKKIARKMSKEIKKGTETLLL